MPTQNCPQSNSETGQDDSAMHSLLQAHRSKYKRRYFDSKFDGMPNEDSVKLDNIDLSICSVDASTGESITAYSEPFLFLQDGQLKQFLVLDNSPRTFCDYIAYHWAKGDDNVLQNIKWLLRISLNDIELDLETAILEHMDLQHSFNFKDLEQEFCSNASMLVLEGCDKEVQPFKSSLFRSFQFVVLASYEDQEQQQCMEKLLYNPISVRVTYKLKQLPNSLVLPITNKIHIIDFHELSPGTLVSKLVITFNDLKKEVENNNGKVSVSDSDGATHLPPVPPIDKDNNIHEVDNHCLQPYEQLQADCDSTTQTHDDFIRCFNDVAIKSSDTSQMQNIDSQTEIAHTAKTENVSDSQSWKALENDIVKNILERLCDRLSLKSGWPEGFEGMYVEDNNIVVDVVQNSQSTISTFMFENCAHIFEEARVDARNVVLFVEQEGTAEFSVNRGAAIFHISEPDIAHSIITSPDVRGIACVKRHCPDDYKLGHGSVACFAEQHHPNTSLKSLYVITARHIFEKDKEELEDVRSGNIDGHYFCEEIDAEKLKHVAEQSNGILGGVIATDTNGREMKRAVDISFIPIKEEPSADCFSGPTPTIYDGAAMLLLDTMVEKLGAVTPYTQGIVKKVNYSARIGNSNCRDCLLVIANPRGRTTTFALPGDSGSLVIRTTNNAVEAIGIVSKRARTWKDTSGNVHDHPTVVVLLKNCFDAIEQKMGVKLTLCAKWEKCHIAPLAPPEQPPSSVLNVD